MQSSTQIRFILVAVFATGTLLPAQTSQPITPAQPPSTASHQPPQHAQVTFTDGQLLISANNSSLNQILRDISRETKMKITGGVAEERVFGQYGPDLPSKVLGDLLDGTSCNMLLLQATGTTPAELILTPRQGGPTPPNPNASSFDDAAESQASRPIAPPEPQVIRTNPTAADSIPHSPNDVRTPQQIYEQLQHMRQLQEQQQQRPQPDPQPQPTPQ
jgi:hypothetical protein